MIPSTFDLSEIKIRRKKLGITQKELAEKAGVSQALIAKIESGQVDPRYSTLKKILKALEELEQKKIRASNVMTRNIVYADEEEKLLDAISKMIKGDFSQLPVRSSDGKIVGTIDEEVLVKTMLKCDPDEVRELKVKDVMKPPLPTVPPDVSINTLISILSENPAVLVVSKGGEPIGIITRSDILSTLKKENP